MFIPFELSVWGDSINFIDELGYLHLNLHPVFRRVRAVGRLDRQLSQAMENVLCFLKVSFGCLYERYCILYIPFRLIETPDLRSQFLGYG
jgi:hypothetical protein